MRPTEPKELECRLVGAWIAWRGLLPFEVAKRVGVDRRSVRRGRRRRVGRRAGREGGARRRGDRRSSASSSGAGWKACR